MHSLLLQYLQKCLGLIGWLLYGIGTLEYISMGPYSYFIIFLYYSNSKSFSSFFYYNYEACFKDYSCYFDRELPYFPFSSSFVLNFNPIFSSV